MNSWSKKLIKELKTPWIIEKSASAVFFGETYFKPWENTHLYIWGSSMLDLLLVFPHVLFLLPLLIVRKVIKYRSRVTVLVHYFQHVPAFLEGNLLSVSWVGHRFSFVVLKSYVSQLNVWNILHVNPAHSKLALPLILGPHTWRCVIVHRWGHHCHPAEMTRTVNREKQQNTALGSLTLPESSIQSFVSMLRTTPYFILYRPAIRKRLIKSNSLGPRMGQTCECHPQNMTWWQKIAHPLQTGRIPLGCSYFFLLVRLK